MVPSEPRQTFRMRLTLLIVASLGVGAEAFGHTPGLSSVAVQVDPGTIRAELTFAQADMETLLPMDANKDGKLTQAEFNARHDILEELALTSFEVTIAGK